METKSIIRRAAASVLALCAAFGGHAFAARGDADMSGHYGARAAVSPSRTIVVDDGTRHINVTRLETAVVRAGGGSETWTFDTLGTRSFPLSKIVPGVDGVTVFVMESPLYSGN